MFPKKINKLSPKKTVLVVPLDWGLGHATRCIPLIRELQNQGYEVIIAAERMIKTLLQNEFQSLTFIELPGYRIAYSRNSRCFPLRLMLQIPGMVWRIYAENFWLKKIKKKYRIEAVFSDNRFGLYNPELPCVFLTHQLQIKTGHIFTDKIVQKLNYSFIERYQRCWVPDFAGEQNLAGELSHPAKLPSNVEYIGCLSRFEKTSNPVENKGLLILLSGPEPQRTIFENILLGQLKIYPGKVLLVRGLPGDADRDKTSTSLFVNDHIQIENHLDASALNSAIQAAEWIICRSGYTTVMDLVKLEKKAILVPTPGQTEQEYLAKYLMKRQMFFSKSQHDFDIQTSLEQAGNFSYTLPSFNMETYKNVITKFIADLNG